VRFVEGALRVVPRLRLGSGVGLLSVAPSTAGWSGCVGVVDGLGCSID
jgi:hypothetical protein